MGEAIREGIIQETTTNELEFDEDLIVKVMKEEILKGGNITYSEKKKYFYGVVNNFQLTRN
jgi:hypothetical protein